MVCIILYHAVTNTCQGKILVSNLHPIGTQLHRYRHAIAPWRSADAMLQCAPVGVIQVRVRVRVREHAIALAMALATATALEIAIAPALASQ